MTVSLPADPLPVASIEASTSLERRAQERREAPRIGDLTLPEFRRIVITTTLFVIVVGIFLWMVRMVIIAAFLGMVIAVYLRPVYLWLLDRIGSRIAAALAGLALLILPSVGLLAYSYFEIVDIAEYLARNEAEIAMQIDAAVRRLPFLEGANSAESIRRMVSMASDYGARLPGLVGSAIGRVTVGAAVFLFTAFYLFLDADKVAAYLRGMIAPRYRELAATLERNTTGVLRGAIYGTLLTQGIKAGVILVLNLVLGVPLAVVLAVLSFLIGFFPIVGSWTVYLPVAGWLLVFRDDTMGALIMVGVGFLLNTVIFSMYLRPKLAADRSHVLNFYWMFLGLVTGVYTFGIAGILLGPIVIGLLKAVVDTVAERTSWRLIGGEEALAGE